MNFTDVFGAQTVPPSEESYIFHNLSGADNQLYWPEQYGGMGYLLADITELAGTGAVAVRLPAADAVSVGESFLLRNRCLDDIQVNDASGAPAALLPAGQTLFFYVVDNTTPAGQWQIFTFGTGTSAADAVALAGDGLSVATGRLQVSSEYRAINSDYPIVPEDRGQILDVVTGTVTITTPDAATAGDGFYCFIRNSSAGNLTLEGYSTQTVNGALSITFAPGDSVILMSTGTNWVTVGYGRSVSGQFSEVIVNAAAGDVTLSSSDVAGRMIRVAGTATTNITITLPAIDNIYFVVVEAGMGAYGATFTTGSGAVTVLTANERTVLTSDGTNVLAAVTTTVTSSLALVDGLAAAPSISFSLDPDTGLFRKGNNVIGVAAGGAEVGSFGSAGFVGDVTGNVSGNAATVTNGVYTTGNQTIGGTKTFSSPIVGSITGNAGTATALQTARTIGGVSFDGTADINLPGVNIAGNQNTSGTAANVTGTVAIANGGTGQTTAAASFDAIKQAASTTYSGVVQLSTATNSTSTTLAATPSAVKAAYDRAAAIAAGTDPQKIAVAAFAAPAAGSNVVLRFQEGEVSRAAGQSLLIGTATCLVPGTIRFSAELKSNASIYTATLTVRKNGVIAGSVSHSGTSYTTKTVDVALALGDRVELTLSCSDISGSDAAYGRYFRALSASNMFALA